MIIKINFEDLKYVHNYAYMEKSKQNTWSDTEYMYFTGRRVYTEPWFKIETNKWVGYIRLSDMKYMKDDNWRYVYGAIAHGTGNLNNVLFKTATEREY